MCRAPGPGRVWVAGRRGRGRCAVPGPQGGRRATHDGGRPSRRRLSAWCGGSAAGARFAPRRPLPPGTGPPSEASPVAAVAPSPVPRSVRGCAAQHLRWVPRWERPGRRITSVRGRSARRRGPADSLGSRGATMCPWCHRAPLGKVASGSAAEASGGMVPVSCRRVTSLRTGPGPERRRLGLGVPASTRRR